MSFHKVRIFYNARSGPGLSRFSRIEEAFRRSWTDCADDVAWYFPASAEDSRRKVATALDDGADLVVVCGGDGTVSSIGVQLVGTDIPLAVVPLGSGNGLARHFRQSMDPVAAIAELAGGAIVPLDVGRANGRPFLVSASVAWDAEIVRAYDRLPMRGVGSYFLAGAMTLIDYAPQPLSVVIDGEESLRIEDPLLFTIGNVSGWGGGALIDPNASASDGRMELLAGRRRDTARMLGDIAVVFKEGSKALPRAIFRTFSKMSVERPAPQPIQLDGEMVDMDASIDFVVEKGAMKILVPNAAAKRVP